MDDGKSLNSKSKCKTKCKL